MTKDFYLLNHNTLEVSKVVAERGSMNIYVDTWYVHKYQKCYRTGIDLFETIAAVQAAALVDFNTHESTHQIRSNNLKAITQGLI